MFGDGHVSFWHVTDYDKITPMLQEKRFRLLTWLHQNELSPTIRLGANGRYQQTTFSFILEPLARQLYRPTLVEVREKQNLRFEARWQPLLDGENEARRAAPLATAMPTSVAPTWKARWKPFASSQPIFVWR
jgi:hypothetical protein